MSAALILRKERPHPGPSCGSPTPTGCASPGSAPTPPAGSWRIWNYGAAATPCRGPQPRRPRYRPTQPALPRRRANQIWLEICALAADVNRKLRRSAHRSVTDLETDVEASIQNRSCGPKPPTTFSTATPVIATNLRRQLTTQNANQRHRAPACTHIGGFIAHATGARRWFGVIATVAMIFTAMTAQAPADAATPHHRVPAAGLLAAPQDVAMLDDGGGWFFRAGGKPDRARRPGDPCRHEQSLSEPRRPRHTIWFAGLGGNTSVTSMQRPALPWFPAPTIVAGPERSRRVQTTLGSSTSSSTARSEGSTSAPSRSRRS